MGYMLPLKYVRVSEHMAICATRIIAIMSTKSYVCKGILKQERAAGTLLNAAGRDKVRSGIILDNGTVIASPFDAARILTNINNAGLKRSDNKKVKISSAIKVYDAIEDEIFDDLVDEYPEMSTMTKKREALPDEAYEPEEDGELVFDGEEVDGE